MSRPNKVKASLERIHRDLARASFLVNDALTLRRVNKAYLVESSHKVESVRKELNDLLAEIYGDG